MCTGWAAKMSRCPPLASSYYLREDGGGGVQFERWKGVNLNLLHLLATSECQQCAGSVCGAEGAPASPRKANSRTPAAWGLIS